MSVRAVARIVSGALMRMQAFGLHLRCHGFGNQVCMRARARHAQDAGTTHTFPVFLAWAHRPTALGAVSSR